MMRNCLLLLLTLPVLLSGCDDTSRQEQPPVVVQNPPAVVDSVQVQVKAYQEQLLQAQDELDKTQWRLSQVSRQLQDSIDGTQVPPQLQEETINTYRNKLHEVRQVQAALKQWESRNAGLSDTLSLQDQKAYLEEQLQALDRLMQETRQVRQEAQAAMQDSDQEAY